MTKEDMIVISVDDHISEPPDMFEKHLTGEKLAAAPKLRLTANGTNYWEYQGFKLPSVGLNAVAGRVPEEYGMEPTAFDQLRKGVYNVDARIDDMNINGIASSLNFGSFVGHDGNLFAKVADRDLGYAHLQAYNDWHIDEWCGAYPGRFIPCGILPIWDIDKTVAEIGRIAAKGCTAVSLTDNPTTQNLPSIHNSCWEPMWKALADNGVTICLHIGVGNSAPHASMETPIEAWITTMPMTIAVGAADWLSLSALHRYDLRVALSEGGIGWVPYFTERADFSNWRHKAWTHSQFGGVKPSELFKKHFLNCFIDDAFGLQNLQAVGEDAVAYECDYPHSDTLWPESPDELWKSLAHLTPGQIDKITHLNAMRFFNFDPFKSIPKEQLTVRALRAQASASGVDTTLKSLGGAAPLAFGEKPRPITSGDVIAMFTEHGKAA